MTSLSRNNHSQDSTRQAPRVPLALQRKQNTNGATLRETHSANDPLEQLLDLIGADVDDALQYDDARDQLFGTDASVFTS